MTQYVPPPNELTRLPGLYRKWELPEVLETCTSYRIESAGAHADGTPLLALFMAGGEPRPKAIFHLHQIDLARRWKLSPRSLERWRCLGVGPRHLKIMGRVLYRLEDVEDFEAVHLSGQLGRADS